MAQIRKPQVAKRIQQDELRERMSNQEHIRHIDVILDEMMATDDMSSTQIQKNKVIIDTKLALIKKYLPDLRQVEITGADGGPVKTVSITSQMDQEKASELYKEMLGNGL